jgi:hypothetical protein
MNAKYKIENKYDRQLMNKDDIQIMNELDKVIITLLYHLNNF